ncbi:unnamed protein product [marine sediment metagenome]|uniref:Uncharacterized protein n=1 Tax=marine sediment metagenome TaxID=412755 RepID=X1IAI3_9ZZZZ
MTAMTRAGTANDPTRTEEMKVRALCEGRIAATDHASTGRVRISPTRPEVMRSQE